VRRDESRLHDIVQAADQIGRHISGLSKADFLSDIKTQDAVIRRIEIMGEAASRISEQFRDAHPEVPWRRLIQLRNFYIHVYETVDEEHLWRTVRRTIPTIRTAVTNLLSSDNACETDADLA
jgi:uncharacterized protein with HEPN domain